MFKLGRRKTGEEGPQIVDPWVQDEQHGIYSLIQYNGKGNVYFSGFGFHSKACEILSAEKY